MLLFAAVSAQTVSVTFTGRDAQNIEIWSGSKKYDIYVNVNGGGVSGQAGAVSHALARAILTIDESMKDTLRKEGLLTRDPRMVERKKPGRPKARKRFQFSKR